MTINGEHQSIVQYLVPSMAVDSGDRSCSGPEVTITGCEIPGCDDRIGGVNQWLNGLENMAPGLDWDNRSNLHNINTSSWTWTCINSCIRRPFSNPHQISWVILVAQDVYGPYRTTNAKTTRHIATWGSCTLTAAPATRALSLIHIWRCRRRG